MNRAISSRSKSKPRIRKRRHVLLLIESSRAYGRGCLAGVAQFLRLNDHWHTLHIERGLSDDVPMSVRKVDFDGVIARIENEEIDDTLDKMGVPVVDLRGSIIPKSGASFDTDPKRCAKLAVEHFQERGYRSLGYCGYPGLAFSDQRGEHFVKLCEQSKISVSVFRRKSPSDTGTSLTDTLAREATGEIPDDDLVDWIASLPTPTGIFACNDIRGRQVLRAVELAGLRSPEDIAVLGVDDDEIICELANPSLSSIEPDTLRLGYDGAVMLDKLMNGRAPRKRRILIPPARIAIRQSTELIAVEDPHVSRAIQFIREYACTGISVASVLEELSISRIALERKFKDSIGRTPREEIERVRLSRVRNLLIDTTYNLKQIAKLTGFRNDAYLITCFKRVEGCTPGKFRQQFDKT